MMDFSLWFLGELPDFLLAPPISAFTGLAVLFVIAALVRRMMFLRR